MSDDDLEYIVNLKLNMSDLEKSLKDVQQQIEKTSQNSLIPDLDKLVELEKQRRQVLDQQLEVKRKQELSDLRAGNDPQAMQKRLAYEKEITLEKHKQMVDELKAGLNPQDIKERVRRERELADIKRETAKLEEVERTKQAGGKFARAKEKILGETKEEQQTNLLGAALGGNVLGKLGGLIGNVLGGSVGAVAGQYLAEMIPQVIAGPAKALNVVLSGISNGLRSLTGQLGAFGFGLDLLSGFLTTVSEGIKKIPIVGEVLGPLLDAVAAVPGIIKGIFETLTSFAAKANPGVIELLNYQIDSLQATIGQAFLPVVQLMVEATRELAIVFANILPNFSEVRQALQPVANAFFEIKEAVNEALSTLGPIIRTYFLDMLKTLGAIIQELVPYIKGLIDWWSTIIGIIGNVIHAIQPLVQIFYTGLLSPLKLLGLALTGASNILKGFYEVFRTVFNKIREWVPLLGSITNELGPLGGENKDLRTATPPAGAAQFQGFRQYANQAYTAAFTQAPTWQSAIQENLPRQTNFLERIDTGINNLVDRVSRSTGIGHAAEAAARGAGSYQTVGPGKEERASFWGNLFDVAGGH